MQHTGSCNTRVHLPSDQSCRLGWTALATQMCSHLIVVKCGERLLQPSTLGQHLRISVDVGVLCKSLSLHAYDRSQLSPYYAGSDQGLIQQHLPLLIYSPACPHFYNTPHSPCSHLCLVQQHLPVLVLFRGQDVGIQGLLIRLQDLKCGETGVNLSYRSITMSD